jgi:multiple sugar transport system substrate-binding protein
MPEGTIFEDNTNEGQIPDSDQNLPSAVNDENKEVTNNNITHQAQPQPVPTSVNNPAPPPPIPPDHSGGLPLKKIFLILLGIISIIIFAILLIIFVSSRSSRENEQQIVSYWGINEDPEIMKSVIADFEKQNPNIRVEYGKQDVTTYREKLSTRFENGTGPDVFTFHSTWFPMFSNNLESIPEEIISKEKFKASNYDVVSNDLIIDNNLIGIPLSIDTLMLYVNPALMQTATSAGGTAFEAPKTWEEFISVSRDLTKRNDRSEIEIGGAGIGTYNNVEHASDIISLLFAQNGVSFNNLGNSGNKIDDAIEFYTNFALVENNVWDNTLDNSLLAFSEGRLAMFFGYASDYKKIKDISPNLNFQVYPVPQLLNEEQVNLVSYWAEGISKDSLNKDAAFKFLAYLNQPEVQEKIIQEQNARNGVQMIPSNKNLAKNMNGSLFAPVLSQLPTAVSSPFVSNTFDNGLNTKLSNLLSSIINRVINNSSVVPSEEIPVEFDRILGEVTGQITPEVEE